MQLGLWNTTPVLLTSFLLTGSKEGGGACPQVQQADSQDPESGIHCPPVLMLTGLTLHHPWQLYSRPALGTCFPRRFVPFSFPSSVSYPTSTW